MDDEADLTHYIVEEARAQRRHVAVHAWVAGNGGGRLAEMGFTEERLFWRMDRPDFTDTAPRSLPTGYRLIDGTSPQMDLNEATRLYNEAFEGEWLQEQMVKYFGCRFEDLFEVVLIDPETKQERVLQPRA